MRGTVPVLIKKGQPLPPMCHIMGTGGFWSLERAKEYAIKHDLLCLKHGPYEVAPYDLIVCVPAIVENEWGEVAP